MDSPSEPALQAGEVDDNRLFSKYLAYVGKYRAQSGEKKFDAAERYLIRVVDGEGRGLPDTPVRVEAVSGQIPLFRARTDSRGRAVFFPNAVGTDVPDTLRLVAAHGPGQEVRRNAQGGEWSLPVSGAKADAAGITLDLLFLVDTTGSMSEEIARVRDTIHSVSSRIKALPARPRLRLGIVLYRDRGDEYVTRRRPFTEDVNAFHSALKEVQADGGGDEPEDLNAGLQQAVEAMDWTPSRAVRLAFVIADAPPHLDYGDEYDYFLAAQRAAEKGIKLFGVSTVGTNDVGEYVFRQMALLTLGRFIFVTRGEGGGSAHHVDRSDYSVQQLDDLVCRLVSEELSGLAGGAQSAGGR